MTVADVVAPLADLDHRTQLRRAVTRLAATGSGYLIALYIFSCAIVSIAPIFVAPVAPDLKDRRCSVCVSRSVLPFYPVG
jgi:hypothetical protein